MGCSADELQLLSSPKLEALFFFTGVISGGKVPPACMGFNHNRAPTNKVTILVFTESNTMLDLNAFPIADIVKQLI